MLGFSSENLGTSLAQIGVGLAVIAAIVGVVVWRGKRRGSRTLAIDAALTVSAWWVILSAVGALILVLKVFATDWAEIASGALWVPWPAALPCDDADGVTAAVLRCGGGSISDITVANASVGLRVLAGAAQLATLAFTTIPAAMVMVICFQTLRGGTFSHTVTRALTVGAAVVLVLGVASDLLGSIAATAGLREVFPPESRWYPMTFQLTVTPLPFAAALGLAALAAVFRQGMRLQRERERLQQETERLQKDTEGLV
ncbi:hypothetical protein [uncultured Microbacterium sp.]|uniref:hypothetical protein n=1 Tax=Microbacterium algeriense TaxID=2615184 RepID=UPI0025935642|nr:hypothetical protein [uncultured Microbacterium sp.]